MHIWWKILHSLHETIKVKCALDGGMNPTNLAICSYLNFHLQDGVVTQWYQRVPKQLWQQGKGQVNQEGH